MRILLLVVVALAGCFDASSEAAATLHFETTNTTITDSGSVTAECTDSATLSVDVPRLQSGTAILVVMDGSGQVAWDREMSEGESGHILFGATGEWEMLVELTNFSGELTVSLDCP